MAAVIDGTPQRDRKLKNSKGVAQSATVSGGKQLGGKNKKRQPTQAGKTAGWKSSTSSRTSLQ
jgi:hypothetical protein